MANVVEATTQQQFEEILAKSGRCLTVVHFQAAWAPQCELMNEVMSELAKEYGSSTFVKLEAEGVPEVSEKYEIASVPTFLFFRAGDKVDRLDGAHAPELTKKVLYFFSNSFVKHAQVCIMVSILVFSRVFYFIFFFKYCTHKTDLP